MISSILDFCELKICLLVHLMFSVLLRPLRRHNLLVSLLQDFCDDIDILLIVEGKQCFKLCWDLADLASGLSLSAHLTVDVLTSRAEESLAKA